MDSGVAEVAVARVIGGGKAAVVLAGDEWRLMETTSIACGVRLTAAGCGYYSLAFMGYVSLLVQIVISGRSGQ